MRFTGPLGFRRLSSFGPLVSEIPDQKELPGRHSPIVHSAAKQLDITDPELSETEEHLMIQEISNMLYPGDANVARAKRFRFSRCMINNWAENWVQGLSSSISTGMPSENERRDNIDIPEDDDISEISLKTAGCVGMTDYLTSDREEFIPQFLKKENLPVPEDANEYGPDSVSPEPPTEETAQDNLPIPVDENEQLPDIIRENIQ